MRIISGRKTILSGLLLLILALCLFPARLQAISPAGTLILTQAKASYFDLATGLRTEAASNFVAILVRQVAGVDGGTADPVFAPQGQQIRFPHIVTNTGNGTDTMLLAFSVSGAFIPHQIAFFDDPNGNGIVDSGETPITVLKEMAIGTTRTVVVFAEIPKTASHGEKTEITMTVRSTVDPSKSYTTTDTIHVSNDASLVLSLSSVPATQIVAGGIINYTLKTTNIGLSLAEPIDIAVRSGSTQGVGGTPTTHHGVLLSLPISANTTFETATAPQSAILIYRVDGVWVDSAPVAEAKGKVKEVGMILLTHGGALIPNQVTSMNLSVAVLPWVSKTTISLTGKILYNDHDTTTEVMTTNSNIATVLINNPNPDGAFFTDSMGNKVTFYRPDQTIFVRVIASSMNKDVAAAETVANLIVYSPTSGEEESVTIFESGENTGIFLSEIPFTKLLDKDMAGLSKSRKMDQLTWRADNEIAQTKKDETPNNKPTKVTATPNDAVLDLVSNSFLYIGFVNPVDQSTMKADVLIDPSGVVFNSITNQVIAGVTVTLLDITNNWAVFGRMITGSDGRFFFNAPAGVYRLAVSTLPSGFSFPSVLQKATLSSIGRTIDDFGSYGQTFMMTTPVAFDIPLDASNPILFVQKKANKQEAEIGDLITYTVEITNTSATLRVSGINLMDQPPIGISYLPGSATCTPPGETVPKPLADPTYERPVVFEIKCTTPIPNHLEPGEKATLTYKAVVGPGAIIGDGVNKANAIGTSIMGAAFSNESIAKVRVIHGVFTDRAIVLGKVFIDLSGDGEQNEGEPGVPEVRLILEDGTQVTTDEDGKYSIYGLTPTTHVLKIDPITLPREFVLSDSSTRFAGDPQTRFIDLTPGELHKANFTIASLSKELWEPIIKERADKIREMTTVTYEETVEDESKPAQTDLKKLIASATADFKIVSPADHALIPIRSTNLILIGHSGIDFKLLVNDNPISDSHVGSIVVSNEKPIAAIEWIAVPLEVGENKITVEGYDGFGNIRHSQTLTLFVPGSLTVLKITAEPKTLPADAVARAAITIRIFDDDGLPVLTRAFLTVKTTKGRLLGEDLDLEMPGHQIAVSGGSATLTLIASDKVEDAIVTATIGDGDKTVGEATVSFLPALRDGVALGILDAKINLRNFKGNIKPADPSHLFKETISGEGKAKLYLKGKILGSALLTLSYDSDKDKNERLFRDIKPTEFYPIYGDASEKKFDAQSSGKLYVKVEQGKSYLLFGDFSPDFTDLELLAYQRSLNGLKYHHENETSAVTAFHNRSEQKQIVDSIAGNGTSGFYQLTRFPIVENSDLVEIITFDRARPGIILRTETMGRFVDYTLESLTGRILFKSPIQSFDADFNPIFIKVTYETSGAGIAFDTYGVNGKLKLLKRLQAGSTFVQSNAPRNRYTLYGVDLRAKLFEGVIASFEVAHSKEGAGGGEGYKFSLSVKPNQRIDATAYWLKTDGGFINPSSNIAGGKIEEGVLAHFMVRQGTILGVELLSSQDERVFTKRVTSDVKIEHGFGDASGEIGLKHIEDQTSAMGSLPPQDKTTQTIRAKIIAPFPNIPRLTTSLEYEEAFNRNANSVTLGNDFRLNSATKFYSKQEWVSGGTNWVGREMGSGGISESGRRLFTTLGINTTAWTDTTAFSEYRIASAISGREGQAAIGLRNRYTLKKGVSLSTTLEQTKTLEGHKDNDATAFSIDFSDLSRSHFKGTTRYEIRKSTTLISHLGGVAIAYRATPNLSLLARETIFVEDEKKGQLDKLRSDLILGAAFRPISTDALHFLTKFEFQYASNGASLSRIYIEAIEANIALQPKTALFLKYANRAVQDGDDFHAMTQMLEGRVTYDITPKIDLGLTGRHFWQVARLRVGADRSKSKLWGYGVEGGYRLDTNLWLSVGYQVNAFDQNSAANDHLFAHGVFMHLRYKFDEGIIAFLKGAPMTLKAEKIVHEIPIPQFSVSFSTVEIEAPPATPIPTAIPVPLLNTTVSYRKPTPVKIGAVQPSVSFTLTGSYFNFASGHLTAKGKKEMANYALFLKQNPNLNITIEGHTDESGSNQNNYQLGMKRAQSVWKELKKSGVQNSMNVTSYGEERPIDPAKTKSAYAKNRRVELRINDGVPLQKERQ